MVLFDRFRNRAFENEQCSSSQIAGWAMLGFLFETEALCRLRRETGHAE
jgi:hypothetical protein